MSNSKNCLELVLKCHLRLKLRKKGMGEASYKEVTRKSTVNKGKVCSADLSRHLLQ